MSESPPNGAGTPGRGENDAPREKKSKKRKREERREEGGVETEGTKDEGVQEAGEEAGKRKSGSKKDKKDKKDKKKREKRAAAEDVEPLPEKDGECDEAEGAFHIAPDESDVVRMDVDDEAAATKRPKRKKAKHKSDDAVEAAEQTGDVAANAKHKAILDKFQKSAQRSERLRQPREEEPEEPSAPREEQPQEKLHDFVPLPQPPLVRREVVPTFAALPTWLAKPVTVKSDTTIPFADLKIHPKLLRQLHAKGYQSAFAIQAAVLPLLLPGERHYSGDMCVSAATGSGKTLAYVVPMVQALRPTAHLTRLRGIIVVPTRELVSQVRDVVELCLPGSGLKVGTAVGGHTLPAEQEALVHKSQRYDPAAAEDLEKRANRRDIRGADPEDGLLDDYVAPWVLPWHVPGYRSKIDILICTPGRLVEHIESTQGFTLEELEWLVIDEADRLLDSSFQEWVDVVIGALEAETLPEKKTVVERLRDMFWAERPKRHVRKVILSATMTRDLQKLGGLKLRRPTFVSVTGGAVEEDTISKESQLAKNGEPVELPSTLKEWAVPVDEAGEKPLYLLSLLQKITKGPITVPGPGSKRRISKQDVGDVDSPSDDSSTAQADDSDSDIARGANGANEATANAIPPTPTNAPPSVLIFANATENAARLSHLLSHLKPAWAPHISTLTKSSSTTRGKKTLAAFRSSASSNPSPEIRILVATDRAARGLDLQSLSHIVNYDMPHSVTDYVHRVGRTARAGREGEAVTMVEGREAWFFWNKVAKGEEVRRWGEVRRVRVKIGGEEEGEEGEEEVRKVYERALEALKAAVAEDGGGRREKDGGKKKAR